MQTPVDFQKERQKRQRSKRIKQILIGVVVIVVIVAALIINDLMVKRNVPVQVGGILSSIGGSGFPVEVPSGTVRDVKSLGNNLVVLKDSNMYVYSKKGKQLDNVQEMNEKTVITSSKTKLLVYDTGGRKAALHSSSSPVHNFELEANIVTADVGESGAVAIVTAPPNFVAEINVYTAKNNLFYTRTFSDTLVSNVAVSTKGKSIAVATLGTETGILESEIIFYDLNSKEELAKTKIADRLVVQLDYFNEDTIGVLTNRDYLMYDTDGNLLSSYSFPENFELQEYRTNNSRLLLLGRDSDTLEYMIVLIGSKGEELASLRKQIRPTDIGFSDKSVYMLLSDGIAEYNNALVLQNQYYYQGIERLGIVNDRVYLIAKNEINILDKSKTIQS